jgi:hypothetical protein
MPAGGRQPGEESHLSFFSFPPGARWQSSAAASTLDGVRPRSQ